MAAWAERIIATASKAAIRMNFNSANVPSIFLPPVNRSMRVLDRSFFRKVVPLSAATIFEAKNISSIRAKLASAGDILAIRSLKPTRDDETQPGRKCILLSPEIRAQAKETWTPTVSELVKENIIDIRPFDLTLTYDDWTMHNILEAILPEFPEDEKETPTGFACAGHVAHVNLREQYLPFRSLIGQVVIDKNPVIKTVINKTEDVGTDSVFRTFPYEVLAGPDDLNVEVSESDCVFKFDFGKVYWNSRLNTEHKRIWAKFKPGETVCDVMAGVGPFAVPAGKQHVFVWANDLNPDSYQGLMYAIDKNKVEQFVSASCADGRDFIRSSSKALPDATRKAKFFSKTEATVKTGKQQAPKGAQSTKGSKQIEVLQEPASFDHYVMNLPGSAVEFLDAFKGTYAGRAAEFSPNTGRHLPMVHVYLFTARMDTEREEGEEVCKKVSTHLGHTITPDTPDVELFDVRLVSPKKKMYCASFRLPPEVAFAQPDSPIS